MRNQIAKRNRRKKGLKIVARKIVDGRGQCFTRFFRVLNTSFLFQRRASRYFRWAAMEN